MVAADIGSRKNYLLLTQKFVITKLKIQNKNEVVLSLYKQTLSVRS